MDGECIGVLKFSYLRPRATFSGKEGDFVFFRDKWSNGPYFLTSNASTIAQAKKPNDMGSKYDIHLQGRIYKLLPGELFYERKGLNYVVLSDEQKLGVIAASWMKIEIAVDSSLPVSVQVFMFWLALSSWRAEVSA